ncbi:MAG: nicotinate (nicotinamide) nucleotide adenylyltransferase [Bacteroidota bacterium]
MKTGLFFGSFNPVHVGHMIIANHMVERTDLDELWMVVSPQNPFKKKDSLAPDHDRLHLITLVTEGHDRIRPSDIEFGLPRPSYTVDTLAYLKDKYPKRTFALIMGGDNLASFHKWKNHERIIADHQIYVYQRPGHEEHLFMDHPHVRIEQAPLMHISASYIRSSIRQGYSIQYLVPDPVFEYLRDSHLYQG